MLATSLLSQPLPAARPDAQSASRLLRSKLSLINHIWLKPPPPSSPCQQLPTAPVSASTCNGHSPLTELGCQRLPVRACALWLSLRVSCPRPALPQTSSFPSAPPPAQSPLESPRRLCDRFARWSLTLERPSISSPQHCQVHKDRKRAFFFKILAQYNEMVERSFALGQQQSPTPCWYLMSSNDSSR